MGRLVVDQANGLLRHAVSWLSGGVVTMGLAGHKTEIVVAAGATSLIAVGASLYEARRKHRQIQALLPIGNPVKAQREDAAQQHLPLDLP